MKNIFKQEKFIPRLTFNPGLALTGFRTTRPWAGSTGRCDYSQDTYKKLQGFRTEIFQHQNVAANHMKVFMSDIDRALHLLFKQFPQKQEST